MIGCLTETTTCVVAKHISFSFMLYNTLHDWIIITSWKRFKNIINLMLFLFHCFNLMLSLNVSLCMYSVFLSILSLYSLYTYQSFNSRGEYCSVFPPPNGGNDFARGVGFQKYKRGKEKRKEKGWKKGEKKRGKKRRGKEKKRKMKKRLGREERRWKEMEGPK